MKILCVSDQIDPLIYTNSLKQSHADVDLILSAGDLPTDYLEFIASTLNKPLLYILGNHHVSDPRPSGAFSVEGRVHHREGCIVAGLGGIMRCNQGENEYTNFRMCLHILGLLPGLLFNRIFRGRFLDILLTHASPRGIHDKEDAPRWGFKCFLRFMRIFKPKYLVHGHIHLYDLSEVRTSKYHDTLVVNAYGYYLIDMGKKSDSP